MTRIIAIALLFLTSCNYTHVNHSGDKIMQGILSLNDSTRVDSYWQLTDSLKKNTYSDEDLLPVSSIILKDADSFLNTALALQSKAKTDDWFWGDNNYLSSRETLGVLLDLLGHIKSDTATRLLRSAEKLSDNKIKMFAAVSLLRKNEQVEDNILQSIAASDECRIWFFKDLKELHKENLFPGKYRTQALIAQSDMVNWLLYPTEMGRVPDQIMLEQVVRRPSEYGEVDVYLFKFRSNDSTFAKDGWMAGVSGGFKVEDEPTDITTGYTFSNFEKWDAKPPQQHLDEVITQIEKAYANSTDGTYKVKN